MSIRRFESVHPPTGGVYLGQRIRFEGDEYLRHTGGPGLCWHCGHPTPWLSISFEAHICSEECGRAKWDEYLEATYVKPMIGGVEYGRP